MVEFRLVNIAHLPIRYADRREHAIPGGNKKV
jgi:hypothetical protein